MISDALPKWTVVSVILLGAVHPQMPMMPMGYGYGGPMVMPMPMPVPVPVGIPMPYPESTTKTTTTTESHNEGDGDNIIPIAIPIPIPHLVQIAIPGFVPQNCMPENKNNKNGNGNGNRNKDCPPCPPCSCNPCTPSFFSYCSPCHQQCRCKNGKENPTPQEANAPRPMPGPAFPMPIPVAAPAPVVIVPFPRFGPQQQHDSECGSHSSSNSCAEESKHDSCESDQSRRKKNRKKSKNRNKWRKSNYDIYRRNFGFIKRNSGDRHDDDDRFIKPVLTYVARNGDIKMERRLSNDEASALLREREPYDSREPSRRDGEAVLYNNVRLIAAEDSNNRPSVIVRSNPGMRNSHRRRQQLLDGNSQHLLGNGRKELVFKAPENKKISNLSVSFQITK